MRELHLISILGISLATLILVALSILISSPLKAAPTGRLNQPISSGTLYTDVRDDNNNAVPSPAFAMSAVILTNSCQTATSTYGSDLQRIYVDNPGDADNGWTLSIAATDGASAKWQSISNEYDYDDPSGSGCDAGQLSLDPSVSTLTLETGTATAITKGVADSFDNNNSITLLSAGPGSDDIWRGYLTGIGVSQTIPASTPAGSYAIDLTQTVINI